MRIVLRIVLGCSCLASLLAAPALAQQPPAQSPAPDAPARLCERLAGVERQRCLAEARDRRERLGREEAEKPRDCDDLFGPAKEICLKRGGTVRARGPETGPSGAAGGSAPSGTR
jgi:hypothetical protein